MYFSLTSLLQGLGLGASLIIAIGAQNSFVLRQGIKRQHVFVTASVCTLCDTLLIMLGVAGFGSLIAAIPLLTIIATWGGAAFLFFYGLRSFRSALHPVTLDSNKPPAESARLRNTVFTILALSLLNPHVYLDTVFLVGSIGAHYPPTQRISFALGAILASFIWFFSLAYGAAWLAPLFKRPIGWRILDSLVGCIMWAIAASLILTALKI